MTSESELTTSYKPLWEPPITKSLKRQDCREMSESSGVAFAELRRYENVPTGVPVCIRQAVACIPHEALEALPGERTNN